MYKDIIKQITETAKDKKCLAGFGVTFAVALVSVLAIIVFTQEPVSSSSDYTPESEVYQEDFSEPDNDFVAEEFISENDIEVPEVTEETRENTITVKSGDTLLKILTGLGLEYSRANDIYLATKKVYDPRDLRVGQELQISMLWNLPENKLIEINNLSTKISKTESVIVERDDEGNYKAEIQKTELTKETYSAEGEIDGILSTAMSKQKVPAGTIAEFINIFSYSVDFRRDIKKGDKFAIIYDSYVTPDGDIAKNGDIIFASLTLGKTQIELYRFKDKSGNVDYYDEKGYAMKKTLSRKPMSYQNARISSPFGKRFHPIYKDYRIHWGIDYAAPKNSLIYAAGDGVIQVAKYNGGYGNYIKIRHNSEYSTAYGHMQKFAKGIRPGKRVKQGQLIGYVGSTGQSTGPHLHYEVIQNGRRVNPLKVKASASENLRGTNLANFKIQVANVQKTQQKMLASKNKSAANDDKLAANAQTLDKKQAKQN